MTKRVLPKPVRGPFQCERGGLLRPLEASLVLPTFVLGLTERFSLSVRYASLLTFERGLTAAPLFKATSKVNYVAWFSSLSERRGAASSLPYWGRASFSLKVLHQISNNLFKAFHFVVLPSITSKSSSGEKQWDYKNQTMRLSK